MRPFQHLAIDKNQLAIKSASVTARSINQKLFGSVLFPRIITAIRTVTSNVELLKATTKSAGITSERYNKFQY